MAAKPRTRFVCDYCGHDEAKWHGRCPKCGQWETLVEMKVSDAPAASPGRQASASVPVVLHEIDPTTERRHPIGISELDRVLGGGLVPGGVVLVGGEPGVGKSTILLQAAGLLATSGKKVLYASGEESPAQLSMRARRLGVAAKTLLVLAETSLEDLIAHAHATKPDLLIVDSVQTVYSSAVSSSPGSVAQLRAVTGALVGLAKQTGTPLLVVGHVTKDGAIAGPKLLEHMVDTVLYFEGREGGPFRIVRAVKNRFGSTNEIGVFEMREQGLVEVPNPSGMFLAERPERAPGSVVVCTMEGTRPLLAEIQALVTPNNYGPPRVTTIGAESGRVLLMLNILQKRGGLDVMGCDVFVNVIGGVKIVEPAADLAIIAALASSFWDRPARTGAVLFGEVGLTGEVRSVSSPGQRLSEVVKLGFDACLMPKGNADTLAKDGGAPKGLDLVPVSAVPDALTALLPAKHRR